MSDFTMSQKLTQIMLGLLATAFLAWAGVVWQGVSKFDVAVLTLKELEEDIDNHVRRPWHEEAGHVMRTNEAALARIDRRLQAIERKLEAHGKASHNGLHSQ